MEIPYNTAEGDASLGAPPAFAVSNNIDIDNQGEAGESDTIRIGTQGTQTQTFIAGIYENPGVCCDYVVVDSNGQLGTASPPGANVKTAYMRRLQKQVQRQAADIRDLKKMQFAFQAEQVRMQQQMAELKTLNEETQVALQKLQAKDELVAQR